MFLDYLSNQFTNIRRFVGIDLNREQILENRETYKDTSLEFVHGEITEWINTQCEKGTIFLACGTFEYFTSNELRELLQLIHAKVSPAAIAISEPIELDLTSEVITKPRGNTSFSHNYPLLFKHCKYHVFRQEVEHIDPDRLLSQVIMVAMTSPKGE